MDALQQQFIEFALQTGVLKFGEFKTKAGRLSPYFFNAGLFNRGATLGQLARFYARTLIAARDAGRVQFTGMLVLYNNVLQSLFRSQILSLGAVFLAIFLMFIVLFRSVKLSLIALVPNLVAVPLVLGNTHFKSADWT